MAMNALRAAVKKTTKGIKGPGKEVKKAERKAYSTSSPPDPAGAQIGRKSSHGSLVGLGPESPSHRATPTSPLVMKSSTSSHSHLSSGQRAEGDHSLSSLTAMAALSSSVPRVNVASYDEQPLNRQVIISITRDVQKFLASVGRLRKSMEESEVTDGEATFVVHVDSAEGCGKDGERDEGCGKDGERDEGCEEGTETLVMQNLSELIQVVQTCLGEHPEMQSTDIINAAKDLMNSHRDCSHSHVSTCPHCNAAIEVLIDAFTNSVQEYLTGDTTTGMGQEPPAKPPSGSSGRSGGLTAGHSANNLHKGFSKSTDNLSTPRYSSYIDLSQPAFAEPIVDQIDQKLMKTEGCVEVATRYLKVRSKYHREMTTYLQNRAKIEYKYQQQMARLARNTKGALEELHMQEECLPFYDLFTSSIDQDLSFATNCNTTYNLQVGSSLIDPLEQRTSECDRIRKELTLTWQKEQKKLSEARTAMKNAKARYRFIGQDLTRVKNVLAGDPYGKQADKRKKELAEHEAKWHEAETSCKQAVALCNDCQYQVHETAQRSILCAYRRTIIEFDMFLKNGLEHYFQLQHNFFQTLPVPMAQNVLDARDYSVGTDLLRYVERHPSQREELEDYQFVEFDPEAEAAAEAEGMSAYDSPRLPTSTSESNLLGAEDQFPRERAASPQPFHAWEGGRTSIPLAVSPRIGKKKVRPRSIPFILESNYDLQTPSPRYSFTRRNSTDHTEKMLNVTSPPFAAEEPIMNRIAQTHTFKKLRTPSRCRECDNYVYFHGSECEQCGLACHKKCLAILAIRCGSRRLAKKMNTFGVDFHKHLRATKRYIPIIVTKCISEIDERGLDTQGLYRISSAKTKIEHLCQLFESGADRLDLSDLPCHLIGSCLKLYFRQLPEPLLTFGLYQEFITFARDASHVLPCNLKQAPKERQTMAEEMLDQLKGLLQKLPYENYITLARLLYHLRRVGSPEHVKYNCMPAGNLGIVYGPNLLRQKEMVASLSLLADMTAQAKAIEILIFHVSDLFHVTEEQLIREHEQEYDDSTTVERLVGDSVEGMVAMRSPQLELNDDTLTAGSRTPYNTPPERRKEIVSELGDVLEALQSVQMSRRSSQPHFSKSQRASLGELRDSTFSTSLPPSLPGTIGGPNSDDTLNTIGKLLRPQTSTPSFDKMLTPVEECRTESHLMHSDDEDDDEGEDSIIQSSSRKIDTVVLPRSLSSQSSIGGGADIESEVSSLSNMSTAGPGPLILSGTDTPPPRGILSGIHTDAEEDDEEEEEEEEEEDTSERFKNEISAMMRHDAYKDEERDSSQSSNDSSPFSDNVKPLFEHDSPPISPQALASFSSSGDSTPVRVTTITRHRRLSNEIPRSRSVTEPSPNLSSTLSLVSPRHLPHKKHPNPRYTPDGVAKFYTTSDLTVASSSPSSTFSSLTFSSQSSISETLADEGPDTLLQKRAIRNIRSQSFDSNLLNVTGPTGLEEDKEDDGERLAQSGALLNGDFEESHSQDTEGTLNPDGSPRDETDSEIDRQTEFSHVDKRWRELRESHKHTDSGISESSISEAKTPIEDEEIPLPDDSQPQHAHCEAPGHRDEVSRTPDTIGEHSSRANHGKADVEEDKQMEEDEEQDRSIELSASTVEETVAQAPHCHRAPLASDTSWDMGPGIEEVALEGSGELSKENKEVFEESDIDSKYRRRAIEASGTDEEESSLDSKYIPRWPVEGSIEESSLDSQFISRRPALISTEGEATVQNHLHDPHESTETRDSSETDDSPAHTSIYSSHTNISLNGSVTLSIRQNSPPLDSPDKHRERDKAKASPRRVSAPGPQVLRVLRITPSVPLSPGKETEYHQTNHHESNYHLVHEFMSPPHELYRTSRYEVQQARVRMVSPEDSPFSPSSPRFNLRRSQSHDNLDDRRGSRANIGSLFILPETSSRQRMAEHERVEGSTEAHSPCLRDYSHASVGNKGLPGTTNAFSGAERNRKDSLGSGSSDGNPRSPRDKKRSRTPKFV